MNTETTINNRLAECLRWRHPVWRRDDVIVSEQTGVLVGEAMKRPPTCARAATSAATISAVYWIRGVSIAAGYASASRSSMASDVARNCGGHCARRRLAQ